MSNVSQIKIAIVYDWFDKWGGVERILLSLHRIFPQAHFYSSFYNRRTASWAEGMSVYTSFMQHFPDIIKSNRLLSLPFFSYAFESFNFTGYDCVLSVSSSFAKGIITKPSVPHICYLLTPTRFLWVSPELYTNQFIGALLSPYISQLKRWDLVASKRPDKIISISKTVSNRSKLYYDIDSDVIYPPFDRPYWEKMKRYKDIDGKIYLFKSYYLVVSRLEPYKRVDLAIRAFNLMPDRNLIIVGEGSVLKYLNSIARKNILFIGKVSDEKLAMLYTHANAVVIPQEEDFGLVSLEAQFFNCPVIAYEKGGVSETVIEGKTGIFFKTQSVVELRKTVECFHMLSYNIKRSLKNDRKSFLDRFSEQQFAKKISESIINLL